MYVDMEEALDAFLQEHPRRNPSTSDWDGGSLEVLTNFIEWCVEGNLHHGETDPESWALVFHKLGVPSGDGGEMVAFYLSKVPSDQ